jgi:hypothetical protein
LEALLSLNTTELLSVDHDKGGARGDVQLPGVLAVVSFDMW